MPDAIVFSTWDWDVFNVPERLALALEIGGFRVLYCEMPVSRFRRRSKPLREVSPGIHSFCPEYLGVKFQGLPVLGSWQWKMVARQIQEHADSLGMKIPFFFYSHVRGLAPLCHEMRALGSRLIHVCMDYPEPYQYELIEISDLTLVIPKIVFTKLRARYGEKVMLIPQSIHLPIVSPQNIVLHQEPSDLAQVARPRLGYLGPIFARLNLPLLREVLSAHPEWQFVCFSDASALPFPNVHSAAWRRPEDLPAYVASFDVGVMPYDCFEEKNLHCVPLKLFDYFLAGLPVVSTDIISLSEYSDLVYFGDTPREFALAIEAALAEPADSAKRARRMEIARAHSTECLARRLDEILNLHPSSPRSAT
jgi:glycosyltransferase involved in cell wall biosynthesis